MGSAWTPWVRPTQSVSACSRALATSASRKAVAPLVMISPASTSCRPRAVSRTSEDVRPKWIQRPSSPIDSATTSTNAATSWLVTRSRSLTASTVNAARSRQASAASAGTFPAAAHASVAASSTSSQPRMRRSSLQTAPISLPRVAADHEWIMRAARRPAFLAPSIATHATGTPGASERRRAARRAPEALAEDRDADHRQVRVGGGDAGERGGHPGAGDQDLEAAHAGGVAVLAHLLRVAMGAHHPHLVADPGLLKSRAGGLHLGLVVLRAHDDPDPRGVDLDLLERGLDLRHRIELGRDLDLGLGARVALHLHCRRLPCSQLATAATALSAMSVRICLPGNQSSARPRTRARAPRPARARARSGSGPGRPR